MVTPMWFGCGIAQVPRLRVRMRSFSRHEDILPCYSKFVWCRANVMPNSNIRALSIIPSILWRALFAKEASPAPIISSTTKMSGSIAVAMANDRRKAMPIEYVRMGIARNSPRPENVAISGNFALIFSCCHTD